MDSGGQYELKTQYTVVKFALGRYHLTRKIHTIAKETQNRDLLVNYASHGDRYSFLTLVDTLFKDSEMTERIRDTVPYVVKHMGADVIMQNEVKFGCAMEQAISHFLASPFTALSKGYAADRLHTCVLIRIYYQNHIDTVSLYLNTINAGKSSG